MKAGPSDRNLPAHRAAASAVPAIRPITVPERVVAPVGFKLFDLARRDGSRIES
jgi:hypothetical protein